MICFELIAQGREAMKINCGKPREIKPSLREFEALLTREEKVSA